MVLLSWPNSSKFSSASSGAGIGGPQDGASGASAEPRVRPDGASGPPDGASGSLAGARVPPDGAWVPPDGAWVPDDASGSLAGASGPPDGASAPDCWPSRMIAAITRKRRLAGPTVSSGA